MSGAKLLGKTNNVIYYPTGLGKKIKEEAKNLVRYHKSFGCTYCHEKRLDSLEFHHRDPNTKDNTVSTLARKTKRHWQLNLLKEEIAKCEVVCANCHRKIHNDITIASNKNLISLVNPYYDFEPEKSSIKETKERIHLRKNVKNKKVVKKSKVDRCKIVWPDKEILQELVWQIPTVSIAEKLGVSDKAVSKKCKKLGIDKPPRGYWAKFNRVYIEE